MSEKIVFDNEDFSAGESDSEAEYSEGVKKILSKTRNRNSKVIESEDELYAFSDSSSESGDQQKNADSDIEGADDDDLPDTRAWGKRKGTFYSTDYVDQDYGGFTEQEEKIAEREEIEARAIQERLTKELDEQDFTLDIFHKKEDIAVEPAQTFVKTDLTNLSDRQKQQLFLKESPEFPGLIQDFKNKMELLHKYFMPVKKLFDNEEIKPSSAMDFVVCQCNLILNYCNNILFYLLLKSKRITVQNHPVVKRLYQFRQLSVQLDPIIEEVIKPQIEEILEKAILNTDTISVTNNDKLKKKPKKLDILKNISTKSEKQVITATISKENSDNEILPSKKRIKLNSSSSSDSEAEEVQTLDHQHTKDEGGKRAITYQIAKNKGLMPKRKKEMRNPRVKHRNKFRKAKIRRKGAVREVRTEIKRYAGELSGIKASVKKSIKIK